MRSLPLAVVALLALPAAASAAGTATYDSATHVVKYRTGFSDVSHLKVGVGYNPPKPTREAPFRFTFEDSGLPQFGGARCTLDRAVLGCTSKGLTVDIDVGQGDDTVSAALYPFLDAQVGLKGGYGDDRL